MPKSETLHTKYEGFAVTKDSEARQILDEKYARFQRAGATLVRLETDWDDTFARGTWPVVRTTLNESDASLHGKLYKMHRDPLRAGTLDSNESRAWQKSALGALVGERIEPILEAAAADGGGVRPGGRELYEHCKERGIPFIVRTASTRQVVEAAAKAGGVKPDIIFATELTTDGETPYDGYITGWNPSSLTYSHNKGLVTSREMIDIQRARPHVIGLGDGPFDRMMIHPQHDTFWIRANGGYEQHSDEWADYLAESFSQIHA